MKACVLILLGFVIAQTSCVLPVPHRRVHTHGIEGRIIDGKTREPIRGAKVISLMSDQELAESDSDGMFRVDSAHGWHGAYLIGPISYSLLPHFDIASPPPPIRILAAGYRSAEFGRGHEYQQSPQKETNVFPLIPK